MWKKQIQPGEKVPLKLTATERKMVLEELTCVDQDYEQIIRTTPSGKPVMMTLDELEDFGGYVAAEANHCDDRKKQKKLDAIFEAIQGVMDKYTDAEPSQTVKIEDTRKAKVIVDQAVQIAQFAAQALVAADKLGIRNKSLDNFSLASAQREVLILVSGVKKSLKTKLAKHGTTFSIGEVASLTLALAEDLPDGNTRMQVALLHLAKHLMDHLQAGIVSALPKANKKSGSKSKVAVLFQFKITLDGIEPPIWRRIQVQDCTLDKLHEHIQTAMGWTNSHLHHFYIDGSWCGDPQLLDDGFSPFEGVDSTRTLLSQIIPKSGKPFAFHYEYDFGDGWRHEILFEGFPPIDSKAKYPLCLEGERACPPEDVGGTWGYENFLAAKDDPDQEEYEMYSEWRPHFDPEAFDAKKATKVMKKGLPDWRATNE